ncbi:MAG: DUF3891 family protein [Oculatellaceae cyanobacterium Prado106]|nr:DUF3891 family protein [Oculatellaceae cyanobacterium Prado106]
MIVHPTQTGWEIIYHRAHALLAAQIGGQWRKVDSPPRLYETIAAISHHDDLEREWEGHHLTQAGAPMDFTLESSTSYPKLRKHLEGSLYRGRWVALLNSMHICRLMAQQQETSAEAAEFLEEQKQAQAQWRQELGISEEDADQAYDFMQWCDRLSLILCQKKLPADERLLEISKAHDGQRYDIKQFQDGTVTVVPWCFENPEFVVNVEASALDEIKFEDNDSLVAALKQAPRHLLEWKFVKV